MLIYSWWLLYHTKRQRDNHILRHYHFYLVLMCLRTYMSVASFPVASVDNDSQVEVAYVL
jgi:hypothetical protein